MRASIFSGWLTIMVVATCGCQQGPTAQPGTPEFTVQSAAAAAKKRDFASYVQCFSEDYQRKEIESTLTWMKIQIPIREMAISEGPESVKQVDAVLVNENKILKLLRVDWDQLIQVSELSDEEQDAAYHEVAEAVKDPAATWAEILKIEGERPIWYGPIESVTAEGDEAQVKTYVEGSKTFDATLKLQKTKGEWKIDERLS